MKLIEQSFEIIEQTDLFKHIELCGRVAYKSEDKITDTSAEQFVNMLIKRGHTSVLEHGTICLAHTYCNKIFDRYTNNPYSRVTVRDSNIYVITNYRVMYENNWLDDLQYSFNDKLPTLHRTTVRFICSRGISHELVRHRAFSFTQESTRYCNYSNDKFNNELTFIKTPMIENKQNPEYAYFRNTLDLIEETYLHLVTHNWKPEEAREILPNNLKTEVIMTGFLNDWLQFCELRTSPTAHPMMRELIIPLYEELKQY